MRLYPHHQVVCGIINLEKALEKLNGVLVVGQVWCTWASVATWRLAVHVTACHEQRSRRPILHAKDIGSSVKLLTLQRFNSD